jgi:hypothetical protein
MRITRSANISTGPTELSKIKTYLGITHRVADSD